MKAAVFEKTGSFVLKDIPAPKIQAADQILLKVDAVSICGTDVHITADPPGYTAKPGTVLGHEFVGTIVETGADVHHLKVGDRVVANPNNYCGVCAFCRKNLPNMCERIEPLGIDFDGAFAEYCVINSKVAYRISEEVPLEQAACAEPLACAINAIKKINILPGESAVVIGCGPIGLIIGMLLKASGIAHCILLETNAFRAGYAKNLGLGTIINPLETDARKEVLEITEIGADYVIDVTGSQFETALSLVRRGGSVILFGVNDKSVSAIPQNIITKGEIAVRGTWLANATFPEAVRMLEENAIDIGSLITDRMSLDQIHEGLDKLAKGQAVKVIIQP